MEEVRAAKKHKQEAPKQDNPGFRIIQLTDLHIFRYMDRHVWGAKGSPKDIFSKNSPWQRGGGSSESDECARRTFELVRKVMRRACDTIDRDVTTPLVVFSGDIVDSRGVDAASQDLAMVLENYRIMWWRLIDIVNGEFGCDWLYLIGNHDIEETEKLGMTKNHLRKIFSGLRGWIGDPTARDHFDDTIFVMNRVMALHIQLLDAHVWRESEQKGYTLHKTHRAKLPTPTEELIAKIAVDASKSKSAKFWVVHTKPGSSPVDPFEEIIPLVKLAVSHEPIFRRGEEMDHTAFKLLHGGDKERAEPWREDFEIPAPPMKQEAGSGGEADKRPIMQLLAEHRFSLLMYGHDHHSDSVYSYRDRSMLTFNGRVGSHFPPSAHEGTNWLRFGRGSCIYDISADKIETFVFEETGGECRFVEGEGADIAQKVGEKWNPSGDDLVVTSKRVLPMYLQQRLMSTMR